MSIEIKKIYEENIQWLNFAELKNGALLTLCVATLGFIIQLNLNVCLKNIAIIFVMIILLICICSFIPFLNQNKYIKKLAYKSYSKKYNSSLIDNNVIFYVNIFLSNKQVYKKALKDILEKPNYSFSKLDNNYLNQIIQISTIASIKYFIFKWGTYLYLVFSLVFVMFLLFS